MWSTSVEVTGLLFEFEVENKIVSKEILVDLPPNPELSEWLRHCPQVPEGAEAQPPKQLRIVFRGQEKCDTIDGRTSMRSTARAW